MSSETKRWVNAGIVLATRPTATVRCPQCEQDELQVIDAYVDATLERHFFCARCGGTNSLLIRLNVQAMRAVVEKCIGRCLAVGDLRLEWLRASEDTLADDERARVRVLEVFPSAGRPMLVLELLNGKLKEGDLLSSDSGEEILLLGVAFANTDTWPANIRLAPAALQSGDSINKGLFEGR